LFLVLPFFLGGQCNKALLERHKPTRFAAKSAFKVVQLYLSCRELRAFPRLGIMTEILIPTKKTPKYVCFRWKAWTPPPANQLRESIFPMR
jgi:hypothetical protein